ncbi:hypothetical protein HRR83_004454 [Exophiala dermatitidis]|uniref:Metallo-beta-lactamase domain-containing protein n=2 Tax=Exophiala dermatitidis TaxID=5970 RepID=H6BQJ2_EXODN|nr:uncharacterized protein HMPREF1120_01992 [Exophiala dermatitidis NIH/UT8656]KAJ4515827.1 hypothetical protein HRR75_003909 [Exophiala dermatitidis]EHY53809.1 hypothetical protein HMPREF1120_01992 [Exophiala dermatitidis NIH/UT8656]KAJ4519522.1 hypothetical protein HRR74_004266 [Exophiala dermatitidis]KAJ4529340.1 hypothetical protein HRR73_000363 [Exophiala dermatitidis]KAJ4544006.1 hypothetical protein HRR76_002081 [Exophiala dermatitidis]
MPITVRPLPSLLPNDPKSHHIGNPPTGFRNPWPSFTETHHGLLSVLKVRFAKDRPAFVPVPSDRSELAPVHKIDFAALQSASDPVFMKVTWIGHASFLIQTTCPSPAPTIPTTSPRTPTLPPPPTPTTTTVSPAPSPAPSNSNRLPPSGQSRTRGINILCDPVFSDRTSPISWLGPKRYTPPPCSLSELLDHIEIDVVLISHNHYDHADAATLKTIWARRKQNVRFIAGLHNARWLVSACGIDRECIIELDWWDRVEIEVDFDIDINQPPAASASAEPGQRQEATAAVGGVQSETSPSNPGKGNETATTSPEAIPRTQPKTDNNTTPSSMEARNSNLDSARARARVQITCTPTQHFSSRSVFDRNHDLWCSYAIEDCSTSLPSGQHRGPKIYFAGDTAYRTVGVTTTISSEAKDEVKDRDRDQTPACPAFKQIGNLLGPFDLALLPIGLCQPREFMSNVHADAWDSVQIHKDVRARKSIGMHWGTVRGGLSAQYEDVRDPPRHWRRAAEEAGLTWGRDVALMDVGETVLVRGERKEGDG